MFGLKLLLSLLFLGYGSWVIYQGLYFDYHPVPATVTESHKTRIRDYSTRRANYYYTFKYEYAYQGKRYLSAQYTHGGRDVSEAVCRYKPGDSLVAYVNPKTPDFAIIERNISGFVVVLTLVGFLMLVQTMLDYYIEYNQNKTNQFLQRTQSVMGPLIAMTLLFGGVAYFVYILIRVVKDGCMT